MIRIYILLVFIISFFAAETVKAQPEITSWIINTTGDTGYAGIPSNIQQVQYSLSNVYVSATCIPGYDIGPWAGNPNLPANQNFLYKITRLPKQNTGTPVEVPLGHIGVWSNGVSIFNARDAFSYNNQGIWNQNAIVAEASSFDTCLGHPAPNGEYHHHLNPKCLYNDHDSAVHSPIIGYAFDGFPIYGAYGYADTNGTGNITRMKSSYRLRNIVQRTTLPDGTVLGVSQHGPDVSSTYPLGLYLEDFEYIPGVGTLDEHNGRFCVTPEYPGGIYTYFVTLNDSLTAAYPYTIGPTYYGTVQAGNTGPGSGHNIVGEPVITYNPSSVNEIKDNIHFFVYPLPAKEYVSFFVEAYTQNNLRAILYNSLAEIVYSQEWVQPSVTYGVDISTLPAGIYFLRLENLTHSSTQKVIVIK